MDVIVESDVERLNKGLKTLRELWKAKPTDGYLLPRDYWRETGFPDAEQIRQVLVKEGYLSPIVDQRTNKPTENDLVTTKGYLAIKTRIETVTTEVIPAQEERPKTYHSVADQIEVADMFDLVKQVRMAIDFVFDENANPPMRANQQAFLRKVALVRGQRNVCVASGSVQLMEDWDRAMRYVLPWTRKRSKKLPMPPIPEKESWVAHTEPKEASP